MLTQKQSDLLRFIKAHTEAHGISPSFSEMCEGVGLKSKSGIHRLLTLLEERGFIVKPNHKARALSVVEQTPENVSLQLENRLLKKEVADLRGRLTAAYSDVYALQRVIARYGIPQIARVA